MYSHTDIDCTILLVTIITTVAGVQFEISCAARLVALERRSVSSYEVGRLGGGQSVLVLFGSSAHCSKISRLPSSSSPIEGICGWGVFHHLDFQSRRTPRLRCRIQRHHVCLFILLDAFPVRSLFSSTPKGGVLPPKVNQWTGMRRLVLLSQIIGCEKGSSSRFASAFLSFACSGAWW